MRKAGARLLPFLRKFCGVFLRVVIFDYHFVFMLPIHAVKGSHPLRVEGGALVATAVAKLSSHREL